jgi:ABC-type sugar transport system substrate-binding protein
MKQSRRKVLKAGAALAAAGAVPATFSRSAFAQAGPVKIGMSMPQTGSLGAGGQAALVALRPVGRRRQPARRPDETARSS